jgi:DNA helicase HerA-like ATPase
LPCVRLPKAKRRTKASTRKTRRRARWSGACTAALGNSRIFNDFENLELDELFKPGQCTIIQLNEVDRREQQVIAATLLRRVYQARMDTAKGKLDRGDPSHLPYPVFCLLEEAHNYAPANADAVSSDVLKTILSEGRKFGVGIGLITQRPGKLDGDVLSQCMTQCIMRITNPIDQDRIASSVESVGRDLLRELPSLSKGQVIVSGASVNTPVLLQGAQTHHRARRAGSRRAGRVDAVVRAGSPRARGARDCALRGEEGQLRR